MGRTRDVSKILTSSTALATDAELSAYLLQSSASSTYLTQTSASTNYLLKSSNKIVQIVYASTGSEITVSNNTFTDTNLTGTITPTSASNKVLVMVTHGANQKDTNNTSMAMRLMRGATEIAGIMGDGGKTGATGRLDFGGTSLNYLDSPATTSATTYKTQFMSQGGNASVACQTSGKLSSIVLMEVTP